MVIVWVPRELLGSDRRSDGLEGKRRFPPAAEVRRSPEPASGRRCTASRSSTRRARSRPKTRQRCADGPTSPQHEPRSGNVATAAGPASPPWEASSAPPDDPKKSARPRTRCPCRPEQSRSTDGNRPTAPTPRRTAGRPAVPSGREDGRRLTPRKPAAADRRAADTAQDRVRARAARRGGTDRSAPRRLRPTCPRSPCSFSIPQEVETFSELLQRLTGP